MFNRYKNPRTIIGVDENGNIIKEYKSYINLLNDGYTLRAYNCCKHNQNPNNKLNTHKNLYWFYKYNPHHNKIKFLIRLLENKCTIIAYPENNFNIDNIIGMYGYKGLKEYNFNSCSVYKCLNKKQKSYSGFSFIKFKNLKYNIKKDIVKNLFI